MALRYCIATGNFLDAATWGLVDATSHLNSESANTQLTTSYVASSGATTGVITVSGVALKLAVRTGTTGTMSVHLAIAGVEVPGTLVTINTADLPVAATADLNGGWHLFKFASPVTLVGATSYTVEARTSSSAQISVYRDGTAANYSRCLVTTTTGAPAAGDDLIIGGEYTGAGTSNSFTVTMDETATTDYGAAATSLVTPAIAICNKGSLTWGTAAATNYLLKLSGNLIIYSGGTLNMGTTGTPCPRDSTMKLNFDCVANVDFGMTVRNLGTWGCQGQSRTSGKNIWYCKLNTNEAANSTSLGVDTDTGWLNNDVIGVASTSRTPGDTESGTLNGNAGASSLTVDGFAGSGGGLLNAHSGTSPTQGEVILLTRNVSIFGLSTTVQSYVQFDSTATVDIDWTEFYYMGSATSLKRGIGFSTITGSASLMYCSFHDFVVSGSALSVPGATTNNYTVQFCCAYNVNVPFINVATTGTAWVVDNYIAMGPTGSTAFTFVDTGGVITNITAAGATATVSINVVEVATPGTINNLTVHSTNGTLNLTSMQFGTISNVTIWRNNAANSLNLTSLRAMVIDGAYLVGNLTNNILINANKRLLLKNVVSNGDTSFATTVGIAFNTNNGGDVRFEDSEFGAVSGIRTPHTQDVLALATGFQDIYFHNCLLASATEVGLQSSMIPGVIFGSQKHDQVAGSHRTWKREGTISTETTAGLFDTTPSVRLTPLIATEKLECLAFSSAVTSGNTLTVTAKVRESVVGDGTDYNGNRIRLIVKRNAAAGIAADTVLATATVASEGAFETLSGTTAAVTDDAVLDFVVDCDGTTGWINIDTWTVASQQDTWGMKYWRDGQPVAYGDNSAGGGSGGGPLIGGRLVI